MREMLTPGRLYARLSAEFRRLKLDQCRRCTLPVPVPIASVSEDGPNWTLAPLSQECVPCSEAIDALVARFQADYDLFDPTTPPARIPPRPAHRPNR